MNQSAPTLDQHMEAEQEVQQYLTIILDQRAYGIPLKRVVEICPNLPLRHMPYMPSAIEGLLDIRGKVIPVMNIRQKLGLAQQSVEQFGNIVIIEISEGQLGILVDRVESVLTAQPGSLVPTSRLLAGQNGYWVTGFVLQDGKVIVLLDIHQWEVQDHAQVEITQIKDIEQRLNASLQQLLELAPDRNAKNSDKVVPEVTATIHRTEEEVLKVIERIEAMLSQADAGVKGYLRLKQEYDAGRLRGQEPLLEALSQNTKNLQTEVFALLGQVQFQDIARQKLEKVLHHIQGLQTVIGVRLGEETKGE